MVQPCNEGAVLPENQNRRLASKRRIKNTTKMLSVVSLVIFISFIIYLIYYKHPKTKENLDSNSSTSDLTSDQISLVNQLGKELSGNFTQEYMKRSQFLTPWLIETDWNLEAAKTMLIDCLEWRKENKIDGILDEDFSHISSEFPIYNDGVDKQGRPVSSMDISEWDVRKASLTDGGEAFLRWTYRSNEYTAKFIQDAQARGQNVSQAIVLYNVNGVNMIQHGCYNCLIYYTKISFAVQDCYPGMVYKLILINMPEVFEFMISFVPKNIEKVIEVYGPNKAEWKKAVLRLISPDQIRPQFGGTKDMEIDY